MTVLRGVLGGLAAGAAGTTALNAVTYLDMVVRARGASSTPEDTAERLADAVGISVPGTGEEQDNRLSGLGPLLGIVTGVGAGGLAGLARAAGVRLPFPVAAIVVGAGAMAGSDAPMAALGVSDPRTWAPADWVSDAVPHLVYGVVTVAVLRLTEA